MRIQLVSEPFVFSLITLDGGSWVVMHHWMAEYPCVSHPINAEACQGHLKLTRWELTRWLHLAASLIEGFLLIAILLVPVRPKKYCHSMGDAPCSPRHSRFAERLQQYWSCLKSMRVLWRLQSCFAILSGSEHTDSSTARTKISPSKRGPRQPLTGRGCSIHGSNNSSLPCMHLQGPAQTTPEPGF